MFTLFSNKVNELIIELEYTFSENFTVNFEFSEILMVGLLAQTIFTELISIIIGSLLSSSVIVVSEIIQRPLKIPQSVSMICGLSPELYIQSVKFKYTILPEIESRLGVSVHTFKFEFEKLLNHHVEKVRINNLHTRLE